MTYSIKANTPEQVRAEIVRWLNTMASHNRIDAAKAKRVEIFKQKAYEAAAYEAAAQFIEKIIIEGEA